MKTRSAWLPMLLGGLVVVAAWPSVAAARSKDEIIQSRKARYPAVVKLRTAGKIGETFLGLPDAVKSDYLGEKVESKGKTITIAQLIKNENTDRTEYFQIVANDTGSTPEAVAKTFSQRRKARLKSGEYWKREDGSWVRKK